MRYLMGMSSIKTLRQLREKRGLTQDELARLARIDQAQISRLERGFGRPTPEAVLRIAEALNLSSATVSRSLAVPTPRSRGSDR